MLHNSSNKYSINICTHWEVNRAKLASRVLFQRPAYYLPETILQQHVRERVFPVGNYAKEHRIMMWLLSKPNATKFVAWLQRMKQRTLSPLPLGIAGMILSEQTNTTLLNTLYTESDIAFSLPPPPLAPEPHPSYHLIVSPALSLSLFWSPLSVGWDPFCPGRDLILAPLVRFVPHLFCSLGSSCPLAYLSIDVTGALGSCSPMCMF